MLQKLRVYAIFLVAIVSMVSCRSRNLLLDLNFGLSDSLFSKSLSRLVENADIELIVKGDDSNYFKNLEIDGNFYRAKIYLNSDPIKSGPLRSYDYSFTAPFELSGNDTVSEHGYNMSLFEVCKASDFANIKSYLDRKYGNGIASTKFDIFGIDTTYRYETREADLLLTHSDLQNKNYMGVSVTVPFYTKAYLEIRCKTYELELSKERERRREVLSPEDVVHISFDPPRMQHQASFASISSDFESQPIYISANNELYLSNVIEDDIIECKGDLTILDAYNDTVAIMELVYKFSSPLSSPAKREWRTMKYNTYKLNSGHFIYRKVENLIRQGRTLKVWFRPTAVVLGNGDVIK